MQNNRQFVKITESIYLNKSKYISEGKYARVFKGCDIKTGQIVAIKEIFSEVYKRDRELIHREMVILEELKLNPHPNIMNYLGSAKTNGTIYFFMEFCVCTLEDRIIKQGRIPQYLVMKWFKQLLEGLTFLHEQKIMHRDLKPANLLLDEFDNIKIADFGLAKHDEVVNTLGTGTPLYKAPEVYIYVNYDERCDVWSAGLILYEMLTGMEFFKDVTTIDVLKYRHAQIGEGKMQIKMPAEQEKDYDKIWVDLIKKMLVYQFQKRNGAKDILQMYKSIYKQLNQKIKKKLSYIDIDLLEVSMSVSSMEKSYHAQNNIHENVGLFNHHESFTNLSNLGKFLFYKKTINKLYQKIKVYASPKVKRNGKELPNQYVYTLIFLILAIHLKKNQQLEKSLKDEEFNLPQIKLLGKQFQLYHKSQFQELVKQQMSQLKAVEPELRKQILSIAGKFKDYLQRKDKKPILLAKYDKICTLAEEFRTTGKLPSLDLLSNLYIVYVTMNDFKVRSEDYLKVDTIELRVYFLMHALAHLDEYFQAKEYASTQYLINRREKLETESSKDMIIQLKKWAQ